jgi:uncharacterized protein YqhQ
MPLIAGLSYEMLKFSDKAQHNPVMKMLMLPGMMLQKLTTQKPDDPQLEVAIKALEEVLGMEKSEAPETPVTPEIPEGQNA